MGPSSRSLELKLMGCKGLQAFNFFQKLSVHAVVSLTIDNPSNKHHHNQHQQQQKTKTDTEGGKDPEWNQDMRFDLGSFSREDFDHLYLLVDLRYEFFGDKSLGEVRVPLTDLVGDGGNGELGENCGVARFVSYEVRNQENKPNGVLSFSYKVVNPGVGGSATAATVTDIASQKNNYGGRIDGYTVVNHVNDDHHHHNQHDPNRDQGHDSASYHHPSTTTASSNHDQQHHHHHNNHDEVVVNRVNDNLIHNHHEQDSASNVPPSSYIQPPDQHLQVPYGHSEQEFSYYYSSVESTAHRIHYPSLETPTYPPPPAGEGYASYPRPDHDQFHYPPPPPDQFHYPPPPGFHPPPPPPGPPPPFYPHPELTRISSDPFPPPQPPLHHHHHHHHHHAAQGEPYPPPSTRDVHEHSYSMPSSMYYNGDGTRRY